MLSFKKSIFVLFLLLGVSAFFIVNIRITNTPATYIPNHLESKILNDELLKEFNNEDTMVLLFQSKKSLDPEMINSLRTFISDIEEFELVTKVRSIFSYESIRAIDGGFEIKNILNLDSDNPIDAIAVSTEVKNDRFVKDFFITKDMKTFGVIVEPNFIDSSLVRQALEKKILSKVDSLKLKKYMIAYGGEFAIDTYQYKELDRMMSIIVPITFLIGVVLLYFLFHSYTAVLIGTFFNGIVTFIVLSLFGAFNWPYNMLASVIPSLLMALCIAFIVHLFNGILLRKERGEDHVDAITNAVEAIKKPSLYSALTTSAGLFSLAISTIPPIRSVGVVGGIGVLVIYVMVVYILPSLLIKFNFGEWGQHIFVKKSLDRITQSLLKLAIGHARLISITFISALAVLSLFIFQIKSESNLYKFFHYDHPVNSSIRAIKENFSGTTMVNLVFDSKSDSIVSSKFNSKLDQLQIEIRKITGIGNVFSTADILKQINWAFHDEKNKYFSIPESDDLIEQYLLVYDGEDLYDFLSRSHGRSKVTLNLNVQGANEIEKVLEKVEAQIRLLEFDEYEWALSGNGKMFSDQENLIMADLYKSVGVSFLVIFLLMSFLWRSALNSMMCMIPNLAPVLAMFIIMGIFSIWLDIGTAMIASITVGIAVDDTIHIFEGFFRRISRMDAKQALMETYQESGKAVIITSLILSAQFCVLIFSNFIPLRNFGLLTTIGIITALVFDLVLLPALLILKYSSKKI